MAKDILLDDADDLLCENGDLVVDESGEQEVGLLLRTDQGDWRASVLVGFGVARRMRNQVSRTEFERDLSTQLLRDGFAEAVVKLDPTTGLRIKARRND